MCIRDSSIIQILSYCNKETSEYHKTIGNLLVNRLNHLLFTQNYEKKLRSFSDIELLNRGFLISLKDEDTKDNSTSFGLVMEEADYRIDMGEMMEEEEVDMEEEVTEERLMEPDIPRLPRILNLAAVDPYNNLNRRAF